MTVTQCYDVGRTPFKSSLYFTELVLQSGVVANVVVTLAGERAEKVRELFFAAMTLSAVSKHVMFHIDNALFDICDGWSGRAYNFRLITNLLTRGVAVLVFIVACHALGVFKSRTESLYLGLLMQGASACFTAYENWREREVLNHFLSNPRRASIVNLSTNVDNPRVLVTHLLASYVIGAFMAATAGYFARLDIFECAMYGGATIFFLKTATTLSELSLSERKDAWSQEALSQRLMVNSVAEAAVLLAAFALGVKRGFFPPENCAKAAVLISLIPLFLNFWERGRLQRVLKSPEVLEFTKI